MDIHKPKPWRGPREFLKEIGTIVIGVLMALGAEQAVEWVHTQEQVRSARAALHDEISGNATYAAEALAEDRCTDAWFDRLTVWAKGGARPDAKDAMVSLSVYPATVWDIVKTGAVAHMPLKEQLAYAQIYFYFQTGSELAERQRNDAQKLASYQGQESLTPDQARSLLEVMASTRPIVQAKVRDGPFVIEAARALGAGPRPLPAAWRRQIETFCAVAGAPAPNWPPGA